MSAHPASLEALQREFLDALRTPSATARAATLARVRRGGPAEAFDPPARLTLYAEAYHGRLVECLAELFPLLLRLTGPDVFAGLAGAYLAAHPPRESTLARVGAGFPAFLVATRPPAPAGLGWPDFLAELAELEATIAAVFDGPGPEGLPPPDLAPWRTLSDDELLAARFEVAPWLALRAYRFPVNAFATRLRRADPDEVLSPPEPASEHVALDRRDFVVRRTPLDRGRFELLQDLRAGRSLTDVLARLSHAGLLPDEATLVAWFDAFARTGWLRPEPAG